MVDKSERDLERRGGAADETARKHKRKLFRQKVGGEGGALLHCTPSRELQKYLFRPDF